MIQALPCPRCATPRTVRMGHWGSVCFNCRHQWGSQEPSQRRTATQPEVANVRIFGSAALQRLEIYRAAVLAGFYSDWPRA